jgi:hypothetical protein
VVNELLSHWTQYKSAVIGSDQIAMPKP